MEKSDLFDPARLFLAISIQCFSKQMAQLHFELKISIAWKFSRCATAFVQAGDVVVKSRLLFQTHLSIFPFVR